MEKLEFNQFELSAICISLVELTFCVEKCLTERIVDAMSKAKLAAAMVGKEKYELAHTIAKREALKLIGEKN
jgi:hypothetical protein